MKVVAHVTGGVWVAGPPATALVPSVAERDWEADQPLAMLALARVPEGSYCDTVTGVLVEDQHAILRVRNPDGEGYRAFDRTEPDHWDAWLRTLSTGALGII